MVVMPTFPPAVDVSVAKQSYEVPELNAALPLSVTAVPAVPVPVVTWTGFRGVPVAL